MKFWYLENGTSFLKTEKIMCKFRWSSREFQKKLIPPTGTPPVALTPIKLKFCPQVYWVRNSKLHNWIYWKCYLWLKIVFVAFMRLKRPNFCQKTQIWFTENFTNKVLTLRNMYVTYNCLSNMYIVCKCVAL